MSVPGRSCTDKSEANPTVRFDRHRSPTTWIHEVGSLLGSLGDVTAGLNESNTNFTVSNSIPFITSERKTHADACAYTLLTSPPSGFTDLDLLFGAWPATDDTEHPFHHAGFTITFSGDSFFRKNVPRELCTASW